MIRKLSALVLAFIAFTTLSEAQVTFDYNPPALGSSEVVKRNDLDAELDGINGAKQDTDAELTCLAGVTSAANKLFYFTGSGTCALIDFGAAIQSLVDDATTSDMRTTLGVAIGVNVQAYDADLTTWAGVTPSADSQSLVSAANYAAMRALLDLEAGTDFYSIAAANAAFQPLDADLTLFSAGTYTDPNLDQLVWWDDSQGRFEFMSIADMTTDGSPATGDYIVIMDSGGGLKKVDWASLPGSSPGITDVVQDTTPQLGGALDTNGFAIEFGTANTDTSVVRSSAGNISIEGNVVYRAGGTDVPLADGGTGASMADPNANRIWYWDDGSNTTDWLSLGSAYTISSDTLRNPRESFCVAASDESTAITTGTAKVTFRMPYAFTLTDIRGSLNTVSSSGSPVIDVNEAGTTIMTTNKVLIDVSEKTSVTAVTAPTITDTSLADDAEMTIDIDTAGTGAKGLKICLIGYQT